MISKARMDKLKEHLELLEKKTGGKLRETPRYEMDFCPIGNFAPDKDKNGHDFYGVNRGGEVKYDIWTTEHNQLFSRSDSIWWDSLAVSTQEQVTKQIIQWIKER